MRYVNRDGKSLNIREIIYDSVDKETGNNIAISIYKIDRVETVKLNIYDTGGVSDEVYNK